jgi:hypothetical protein
MPDMTEAARSVDKVSMWEGGFASHARILNFVSDVTYAGTKIGEIFIGLSTPETFQTRKQFIFIATSSCLILLFLVAVFRYQTIKAFMMKYLNFNRSNAAMNTTLNGSLISCPLCGTQKPFSSKLFNQSSIDKFLAIGDSKLESNPGDIADSKRIDSQELQKKEDLSWIRRQIILRCTEIINKLAV